MGIRRGRTVLDFGCGLGMYTTLVAKKVGGQEEVDALDKGKKALDELVKKALRMR
ncbi:MAG: methyltransferase [Chloroflexota bacterium]|nr:methyltransferase [Chloroflexota bacterium]